MWIAGSRWPASLFFSTFTDKTRLTSRMTIRWKSTFVQKNSLLQYAKYDSYVCFYCTITRAICAFFIMYLWYLCYIRDIYVTFHVFTLNFRYLRCICEIYVKFPMFTLNLRYKQYTWYLRHLRDFYVIFAIFTIYKCNIDNIFGTFAVYLWYICDKLRDTLDLIFS